MKYRDSEAPTEAIRERRFPRGPAAKNMNASNPHTEMRAVIEIFDYRRDGVEQANSAVAELYARQRSFNIHTKHLAQ
jgi:hypothetical protein